ncbi:hypothetical protein IC762_17875 [Bradyrhizobium genosp. L]|uniref:hypothetical protein n=1 Tax=Bradyrhizobium genosp. L TaxID=83637 RepID=UPI0018A2CFC9|nr:hypothetical protein [Bradyrhizobium genosp. L]QPF81692.1 hypothetical protein IC762_17875 [Bradyrhizobium genosp. L]
MDFLKGFNWVAVLGIVVAVETQLGNGSMSLANMVPEAWIPYVKAWAANLGSVGALIMSAGAFGPRPAGQFTVTPAVKPAVMLAIATGLLLSCGINGARAQTRQPVRAAAPAGDATPAAPSPSSLPTLGSYTAGKPHLLKIPNPLGLPDPMCITDHPGASCPTGTVTGGGVKMTGDANKDLADFIKRGGITLVRDMMRADQFLSYPCAVGPVAAGSTCTKTDGLSSSCIEAIVPIAKLVVNGPPVAPSPTASPAAASAAPTPTPSATPTPSSTVLTLDGLPAVEGPDGTTMSTDSPAVTSADDGVVTQAAKLDIVFIALTGPSLKAGCAGWVQDKLQAGTGLAAGVMTFVTTLGVAGA